MEPTGDMRLVGLAFCDRAKVALGGAKAARRRRNPTRRFKRPRLAVYLIGFGSPKWRFRIRWRKHQNIRYIHKRKAFGRV